MKTKTIDVVDKFIGSANVSEITIGCSDSKVYKIEKEDNTYYLKVATKGLLTREYNALNWLQEKLEVPKIVLYDDTTEKEYLITESIPGEMVCSDNMINNPNKALDIIVEAFNNIYKVDIKNCPFNVGLDYKLNIIENNVKNNLINYNDLKDNTKEKFNSLEEIVKYLKDNKFKEELCFSHGDTSLPNIFANDNHFSGFIDVGECGIADKWFDLAICEKSIKRNYGQEYVKKFYEKLNIKEDRFKIDYYLLMMELYL